MHAWKSLNCFGFSVQLKKDRSSHTIERENSHASKEGGGGGRGSLGTSPGVTTSKLARGSQIPLQPLGKSSSNLSPPIVKAGKTADPEDVDTYVESTTEGSGAEHDAVPEEA